MSGQRRRIPFGSDRPNFRTDAPPSDALPPAESAHDQQPTSAADSSAASPTDQESGLNPNDWRNQRGSFRCPVQPEQQVAVLASKRKRHAVRLLNRSAGGFCVAYTGPAQFKSGQMLRLLSVSGEHRVRVVYALRNREDIHIGLTDLGLVGQHSSKLATGALFVIIALAAAALAQFL